MQNKLTEKLIKDIEASPEVRLITGGGHKTFGRLVGTIWVREDRYIVNNRLELTRQGVAKSFDVYFDGEKIDWIYSDFEKILDLLDKKVKETERNKLNRYLESA